MTQTTDSTNGNAATEASSWFIFRAENKERSDAKLPAPPPWRRFDQAGAAEPTTDYEVPKAVVRAPFLLGKRELTVINTALHLRRPLLVTGRPGAGKSTLAHALAHELVLGKVLIWPINTRSTLGEGLYRYDAVARLQAANLNKNEAGEGSIGKFLRLGPLGTALARQQRARVLLIDEIDKSDVDFPNDLLHVLETGEFEIPELSRSSQDDRPKVRVHDLDQEVSTDKGWIRCREFPLIVMTSNGEREFPPAFLRRCVRLELNVPSDEELAKIVLGHLREESLPKGFNDEVLALAKTFLERAQQNDLATDQLMNAAYLLLRQVPLDDDMKKTVFRPLSGSESV